MLLTLVFKNTSFSLTTVIKLNFPKRTTAQRLKKKLNILKKSLLSLCVRLLKTLSTKFI